ncbi:MAG: ubiquitin family protein, partial [archaeon]|nr:ubiquitin family protein [archaeon]
MENTQNETFGMDPMHFKNIMGLVNDLISNANQNDSENGFFQKFQKTYYTTLFHFVNCSTVTQLNQGTTPNTFKMGYFYIINYLNCRFDYVNNIMRGEEVFEYIKCILITIQNYRNISLTVQGLSEEDFRKMNQFVLKEEAQIIQPGEISATHENTIVRIFFDFLLKKKVINQILLFGNNKNLNCYWQIYFLYFIKDYFSVFNLENAMNNKVIQEVFNSYANASLLVYNTITSNPESIKDNKKEELDTILKYMTEINKFMFMLFHGNTNKEVHVIIKKEIEIADVILKFPQLNSKVIALKFLNELCKEGLNANQTQIQLPPQNPPQGPIGPNENLFTRMANCMNPNNSNKENNEYLPKKMELLYDYFTQQIKIMDVIFGENMHEALIQNSYFILKYLYIKRIIGSEQISNLWNLSLNKHIFKAQIFMALNNLAPYLNEADSNFLLKSIADSEYNSINEVTISILTGLAPSLKLAEQKEKVIEIFFKFSNENALRFGMSPQTASVIRNSMIEVLLKPEYWYYLKKYIKKSIYCIGCNNMPKTYLEFLKTTLKKIKEKSDIELYKAFHPSVNDFRSLINFFDRKYSLINIILYNILDIKKEVVYYAENIAKYQNFLQIHQGNEINQPLEDFFNFKELFEGFDHKIELEKDEWIHGLEAEQNRQQQPNNFGNIFNENQSFHSDSSNQFINPNNPQQNNPLVNISGNANANPNVTLSTDKSLDNEGDIITNADNDLDQDIATDYNEEDFHSIWSDIDNIEESRKFFIRNFMKDFKADLSPPNILSGNNLYLVLKNLKMNYYNQNCYDLIKDIIEFISELILKGGILIKKNIIIYLYDVLVKNAIYNDDIEIFFGFFNDIVKQQIKINQTFISDELLSYLIFEVCLVTDCRYNYISCYELIRTFFIYFNWRHNNLEYMSNSDTVSKINNFSVLVCFDSIWECYLLSVNKELERKAFAFIMNILMVASKNNSENIQKISQKIFNDISEYGQPPNSQRNSQQQGFNINQQDVNMDQSNIKSENESYILKLLNLFSEYLKLIKAQSGNGASDYQVIQNGEGFNPVMDKGHSQKISIYFINNYYTNNETQKNHIKVNKNGNVNKLRDTIIKEIATLKANDATLDEIQREEKKKEIIGELNRTGVMLFYKGQILKDGQSLNQLNMEDNATIMVSKDSKDEQMDVDTAPDPASNVKEAVKGLKEIWSGMTDDFLEAALKMNNYDQEKTAIDLTKDEFLVKVKQFQENEFANLVNNLEDNDNKSQTVETDIVDDFQPKGENNNVGNNNGPNNNTAPINNGSNNNPNINQANAQTQTNIINPNENQNFQNQGAPMPFDPNAQQ